MFRKFVWLFLVLPAGVILIAFSLANRHSVRLILDPLSTQDPYLSISAPLFLLLLSSLLIGVLLGGFATWLGQGKWRKQARENARQVDTLRARNDLLDERLNEANARQIERAEAAE